MATSWKEAQSNEIQYWDKAFAAETNLRFFSSIENVHFTVKHFLRHHLDFTTFEGATMLDLGCGPTGHVVGMSKVNKGYFRQIYGVDPLMDHYLNYGTMQETDVVRLVASKVEDLALPLKFDLIISTNVVDHVDDPASFIRKASELLAPGGVFLVSVHCVSNLLVPFKGYMKYIDKNHPHHFSLSQFQALLRAEFRKTELTTTARIVEDLPEYHWSDILLKPSLRSVRRLFGNWAMKSYYFTCSHS